MSWRCAGYGCGCRLKCGEFRPKNRLARFEPMVDFRQNSAEREMFQTLRKTRQNTHDDAASLRTILGLAGASRLPGHRLRAGLTFAAIIGRLDFRMQNEHEQLFGMIHQLVLQTYELRIVGGCRFAHFFAVPATNHPNARLQLVGLGLPSRRQTTIAAETYGVVVNGKQRIQKPLVLTIVRIAKRQRNCLTEKMSPTKLVFGELRLVGGVIQTSLPRRP